MFSQYKNLFLTIVNWLILAIIVLLWLKFALHNNGSEGIQTANSFLVNDRIESPTKNNGSIAQFHIFGSKQKLYETSLTANTSTLDLVLNGTMSNDNKLTGYAYISDGKGEQKKFKVGEKIFNVATLKEIHDSYIIISHNGKSERIGLPENHNTTSDSTPRKTAKSKSSNNFLNHINGGKTPQQMLKQQKFDPKTIQKIASNVKLVSNQSGQIQGLRVSNLAQGDLLTKYGLKSNDIITAINGNRITAKNMMKFQDILTKSPNATVTI
ncbi:MAG TPA: hypothetical protein ENJ44_07225, partial [Oceanospirillales bacterium]|nr:hypothetical protein [Oceanospirillales bacterium]